MWKRFFAKTGIARSLSGQLHARGWLSVFVVVGITFMLLVSFGRVIANARSNYDVYLFEKDGLTVLQADNAELQRELDYYSSYEYKRLYARDYLHLAEPGETLYKIVGNQQYYQVTAVAPNFVPPSSYADWWLQLL